METFDGQSQPQGGPSTRSRGETTGLDRKEPPRQVVLAIQQKGQELFHNKGRYSKGRTSSKVSTQGPFFPGRNTLSKQPAASTLPARQIEYPGARIGQVSTSSAGRTSAGNREAVHSSRRPLHDPPHIPYDRSVSQSHQTRNNDVRRIDMPNTPASISSQMISSYSQNGSIPGEPHYIPPGVNPVEPFKPSMPGDFPVSPPERRHRQSTPPLHLFNTRSKGGDSSSFDQEPGPPTRNVSDSTTSHAYEERPPSSGHRNSGDQRNSSSSPIIVDDDAPPPHLPSPPPPRSTRRNLSPTGHGFGTHAGRSSGHSLKKDGEERRRSLASSSASPEKRNPSVSREAQSRPRESPSNLRIIDHEEEPQEEIEEPNGLSDSEGISWLPHDPGGSGDRKGKGREVSAETPSQRPASVSSRGKKSGPGYVEVDELHPLPWQGKQTKAENASVRSKINAIENSGSSRKPRSDSTEHEWKTRDDPKNHDLKNRGQGKASSSTSPDKLANGTKSHRQKTDFSRSNPNAPIPSSLKPTSSQAPQTPQIPSALAAHVAGIQRAWMTMNGDASLVLPLSLGCVSIQGQNLVLGGKAGISAEDSVSVDLNELTSAKALADTPQSLLSINFRFTSRRSHRSFLGMTRPQDPVAQYPDRPMLTVVLLFEENAARAVEFVNFFVKWCPTVVVTKLSQTAFEALVAQNPVSEQLITKAPPQRRAPIIDLAKQVEASSSKSTPRPTARPAKQADVEQLASRRKSKIKKPDDPDPTQSRLSFGPSKTSSSKQNDTPVAVRRSARKSGVSPVKYDESEDASDVPKAYTIKPLPAAERNVLLFDYPLEGRALVQITKGERHRVDNGDFLNDILVEFGLRQTLASLTQEVQDNVYLFNSFFYNKISDKKQKAKKADPDTDGHPPWPGYDSVKKWTKKADVFNKDFLIVPINEEYHWYLAIIYRPRGILTERPPTPAPSTQPQTTPGRDVTMEDLEPSPVMTRSKHTTGADNGHHESSEVEQAGVSSVLLAPLEADESFDPIDSLPRDLETGLEMDVDDIGRASQRMSRISIDPKATDAPPSPASPEKVADEDVEMPEDKPSPPPKPDYEILKGNDCWIFTFDSLGGSHKAVATHLNQWLEYEARDKGYMTHNRPSLGKYIEAKVPSQPNFSDCGLFLVHYAKQLLGNSTETLQFIQRLAPRFKSADRVPWEDDMKTIWKENETRDLRRTWRDDIDVITQQYRASRGLKTLEPPNAEVEKAATSAPPDVPSTQESITLMDQPQAARLATRGASADPRPSTRSPTITTHVLPTTIAVDRIQRRSAEPSGTPRQRSVPITKLDSATALETEPLDPKLYASSAESVRLIDTEQDMRAHIGNARARSSSRARTDKSPSTADLHPDLFDSPRASTREVVPEMLPGTVTPSDSGSTSNNTSSTSDAGFRRQAGERASPPRRDHELAQPDQASPFECSGRYHERRERSSKPLLIGSPDRSITSEVETRAFGFLSSPSRHAARDDTIRGDRQVSVAGSSSAGSIMEVDENGDTRALSTDEMESRALSTEEDEPIEERTEQDPLPIPPRTPKTRRGLQDHQTQSSDLTTAPPTSQDPPASQTRQHSPSLPASGPSRSNPHTYGSKQPSKRTREPSTDFVTPTQPGGKKSRKLMNLHSLPARDDPDFEGDELDHTDEEEMEEKNAPPPSMAPTQATTKQQTRSGGTKAEPIDVDESDEDK